jgi:3-phenylpropionate/cinnamic acid dioxygenase small subunit
VAHDSSHALPADDVARIAEVLRRCGQAVDDGDRDLLDATLDDPFVLVAGEHEHVGADALRASVEAVDPLRSHHVDLGQTLELAPGVVRAWSRYTAITTEGLARAGDYVDVLVRRPDGWRLAHREVWRRDDVAGDPAGTSRPALDQARFEQAPLPGVVRLPAAPAPVAPEDHAAILRTLHRYALAVDERRWDVWDEIFAPDAVLDFSESSWGPAPAGAWGDGSPAAVRAVLEANDRTRLGGQHLLLNSLVEVDGDRAEVRSEYVAHTLAVTTDPRVAVKVDTGGHYEDVLRRVGNRWLLERRTSWVLWQTHVELPLPPNRVRR